jgi:2-isopropylmalate synthase
VLRRLYTTAIECGARRLCLCDTTGHATPQGVRALFRFMRQVVAETGEAVPIDWHGHRDRGLALANSLAAIEAGAARVHATALGIGERVGNTPMELLLETLSGLGARKVDAEALRGYTDAVARACGVALPPCWPSLAGRTPVLEEVAR